MAVRVTAMTGKITRDTRATQISLRLIGRDRERAMRSSTQPGAPSRRRHHGRSSAGLRAIASSNRTTAPNLMLPSQFGCDLLHTFRRSRSRDGAFIGCEGPGLGREWTSRRGRTFGAAGDPPTRSYPSIWRVVVRRCPASSALRSGNRRVHRSGDGGCRLRTVTVVAIESSLACGPANPGQGR
jgi:hypothetical protein